MNDSTRVLEPESPSNSEETFCVGRTTETMFERDITLAVVAVELVDIQVQNQALCKWNCLELTYIIYHIYIITMHYVSTGQHVYIHLYHPIVYFQRTV